MAIYGNLTRKQREEEQQLKLKKVDLIRKVLRVQRKEGLSTTFKELMGLTIDDLKILID